VGFVAAPFGFRRGREDRELRARAYGSLESFGIADVANEPCHGLPFGTLKRVELARAMAVGPRMLMLDEPAGGLTQSDVRELGALLRHLRDIKGLTLLLVEHHMQLVMDVSDYVVALDFGRNLVQGTPEQVRSDPKLVEAYLGRAA
jgi:branched-chain amino acid transport system ATP-binding protein